ncbi:hypothetical protein SAMN05216228_100217 [Rhizobium tibeticum]|uniref:Tail assembly chaperone n=1 Tax=Rhizobium tibeticum TaxID=501024 RepID=A0A1H8DDD8_9HYPH|nr:hypothetical protein [Rhizobium tibeticum]SEH51392.1 hypothetical protein RTCCBAU85039_0838 [Rhizobium tibeticum]SEN05302.1 hypothetical protein SAMN05216228_100217 [Rhizobium tibeticum]
MSALAQAKAHFTGHTRQSVDVPEWGAEGKPLRVFYGAMTVAQRRKVWRDEEGKVVDGNTACVRAILFQAFDKDGKRLFDDMDEHALTHEVDSEVVSRVGAVILGFVKGEPVKADKQVDDAKNG